MVRLKKIREVRGEKDPFWAFWNELEDVLKCKKPKSNEWKQMDNDDIVLGEVWTQSIGEFYYKHRVHKFSYLYVASQGLVIDMHGHDEPANGGKQVRKTKEWYFYPDGAVYFCDKGEKHVLFNPYNHPIYVLSVKACSNGQR